MDTRKELAGLRETCKGAIAIGSNKTKEHAIKWVKEPKKPLPTAGRFLILSAGSILLWVSLLTSDPVATLLITPVALTGAFLVIGLRTEGPATPGSSQEVATEPKERVESDKQSGERADGDGFWEQVMPSVPNTAPQMTSESDDARESEGCPGTPEKRVDFTKSQVREVSEVASPERTPDIDDISEMESAEIPNMGISVPSEKVSNLPNSPEEPQVRQVSEQIRTEDCAPSGDDTESDEEISASEAPEKYIETLVKINGLGASVRDLERLTGRPRSTVQGWLAKGREGRDKERLRTAATAARPLVADPVPRVVLPGIWQGDEGHVQEVRYREGAVKFSGPPREESEVVDHLGFVRRVFLGETPAAQGDWVVEFDSGRVSGRVYSRGMTFSGCWTEMGVVVLEEVLFQ